MIKLHKITRQNRLLIYAFILISFIPVGIFLAKNPSSARADSFLKFDEGYGNTTKDVQDNASGTITNALWRDESFCVSGKCLFFDGNGDFVSLGDESDFDFAETTNWTVMFWFKRAPKTSGTDVFISKTTASAGYKIQMESDGDITFAVDDDATWTPDDFATSTAATYDDNQWHHVAAVKTGTTKIELFIDGQLVASDSSLSSTGTLVNSANFYVGVDGDGTSNYFTGFIDEVNIYTTTARDESTIKSDAIEGAGKAGSNAVFGNQVSNLSNGLVGLWDLDENTGTITYDRSGNNNHSNTPFTGNATWTPGKYGSGIVFDGTDDGITIAETTTIDVGSTTSSYTVSAWFNTTTDFSTNGLITCKCGASVYPFRLEMTSAELVIFRVSDGSNTPLSTNTVTLNDGRWHQATGVRDVLNDRIYLYIDGVLVDSDVDTTTATTANNNNLTIGIADTSSGDFNGSIDNVRMYDRALTPSEVKKLYESAPGPLVHLKLDENTGTSSVQDSSTNGYTGTLSGTMTNADWVAGKFGSALDLDGSDDRITSSVPFPTNDFTYTTWINPSTLGASNTLFGGPQATSGGHELQIDTDTDGDIDVVVNTTIVINGTNGKITAGSWYHIAVTRSGSTVTSYINGVQDGTGTDANTLAFASCPLSIGASQSSTTCSSSISNYFQGKMDDVKVYNYARTPTQILEDMNAGHPLLGSPVGSAVAEWKFDTGYGTTAYDNSINQNHLTLNTASWSTNGKFDRAWNGTGGNVRLSRTSDADLEFSATDSFSLSLWFKSDSASNPVATEYLMSSGGPASTAGYALYLNTSGQACFGIDDDTTWGPDVASCSSNDVYDNTWHHILAVRSVSQDTISIYIDGVLRDSDADTTTATLDSSPTFYLGDIDTDDAGSGEEFAGDIDEVSIFRTDLTAEQVKIMTNLGSPTMLGSTSTDSAGSGTLSNLNEYCPPGQGSSCTGPYFEWRFDENTGSSVNDTTGNQENGTITNATWTNGKRGSALDFNGTSAYVTSDSVVTDPGTVNGSYSMEAWIYPRAFPGGGNYDTFFIMDGDYWMELNNTDELNCGFGSGTDHTTTTANLSTNTWYHIICVFDTTADTFKIYVNGREEYSAGETASPPNVSSGIYVGACGVCGPGQHVNGIIDDIKIYNYARTPAQVAWGYNKGRPNAWWKFDENSGSPSTLNDSSGFGYSGTAGGSMDSNDWVVGKLNTALDFDGTDDLVNVAYNADIDFTENLSIAFWFKPDSTIQTGFSNTIGLMSKAFSNTDSENDWQFSWLDSQSGRMRFGTYGDSIQTTTSSWTGGAWYHVTVVVNNTNTANIYVNGRLDTYNGDADISTNPINGSQNTPLLIGETRTVQGDFFFDGKIDDVRLYNYPLSLDQIQTIVNQGAVSF